MKYLNGIVFIFFIIFSSLNFASDSPSDSSDDPHNNDITKDLGDCPPITAEQIENLSDSGCKSGELDPWIVGDLLEEEPEDKEVPSEEETEEGNERDSGFFGGIGSFATSSESHAHIYNSVGKNKRRIRDRRRTHNLDGTATDEESNVPTDPVWTNPQSENNHLGKGTNQGSVTSPVVESVLALKKYFNSIEEGGYGYSEVYDAIKDGDWEDSYLLENISIGGLAAGVVAIIYLGPRALGLLPIFGSSAVYADFDTQYKEHPEDILEVIDLERLGWLLEVPEIRMNTLAILKFAKEKVCEDMDNDIVTEEGTQYCQKFDLIME